MSHAQKSLESLLAKPGRRPNSGSHDGISYLHVVDELLTDIESYRNRGYSLGEIYGALVRGGDLGCTLSTFKTYYYRLKQLKYGSVFPSASVKAPMQSSRLPVERGPHGGQSTPDAETMEDESSLAVDETTDHSGSESSMPEAPISETPSLLGMSDDELETQQALARRLFDQRRAELGIRRRE